MSEKSILLAVVLAAAAADAGAGPRLQDDGSKIPSKSNTVDEERPTGYTPPEGLKPWTEEPSDDVDDGTVDWCETHPNAPACNVSKKPSPPPPPKTNPVKTPPKPGNGAASSHDHADMPAGGSSAGGAKGRGEDAKKDAEKDAEKDRSEPLKGTAPEIRSDGQGMNPAAARKAQAAAARGAAVGRELNEQRSDSLPDMPKSKAAGAGRGAPEGGGQAGGMDLKVAAASGYAASFAAEGLQMGADGRVRRGDGRPASRADLRRLSERIESDPRALMRRPDFFNVLDRGAFERLKTDYGAKPEERDKAFTHVGMTEKERDFVRTESCTPKLDKGCSPAAEDPYKKGDFVLPEELAKIDQLLHPSAERAAPAAPDFDALDEDELADEEAVVQAGPSAASGVTELLARVFGRRGPQPAASGRPETAAASGAPAPPAPGRAGRPAGAWLALGAAALGVICWLVLRRRA